MYTVFRTQREETSLNKRIRRNKKKMKTRAIAVLDFSDLEGFKHAGEEQEKLTQLIKEYAKGNPHITFSDVDMKERRTNKQPNIREMKFRNN